MGGPHSETHSIVERCSSSQASNQLTAISDLLSQPACVTSKRLYIVPVAMSTITRYHLTGIL